MKKPQFITYKTFPSKESARDLMELLDHNKIEFIIENNSVLFDPSFTNNPFNKEFRLQILDADFEKVDELLNSIAEKDIESIEEDYYLFRFSNEELMEILYQRDQWGEWDYALAQKILKDRDIEVNQQQLYELKRKRLQELSQPEGEQKVWVIAGYIFAILGGAIGMLIGWHLYYYKKVLPDGNTVYGYSQNDRKHGLRILIIGVISFLTWFIYKVFLSRSSVI